MTVPLPTGYIAATIPAAVIPYSGTTLFHVAMFNFDDPLQWVSIARLNKLTDPWLFTLTQILIPPIVPSGPQTGILGP